MNERLETNDLLKKNGHGSIKYTQFVVNWLKHAKPPVVALRVWPKHLINKDCP